VWFRPRSHRSDRLAAVIGEGCEIEGRCRFAGVAVVEGRVSADLVTADELIVEESATIVATVQAKVVVVRGAITGRIVSGQRVELGRTARVNGDIESPVLVVADGAIFHGRCEVTRPLGDIAAAAAVVPVTT
jgi:cytoskeletal protein CcmA (bactofilin family)